VVSWHRLSRKVVAALPSEVFKIQTSPRVINLTGTVLNRGLDWITTSRPFQFQLLYDSELQHLIDLHGVVVGYGHRTSPVLQRRTNIVDTKTISQSHGNDLGIKNVSQSHMGEASNDTESLTRAESHFFFTRITT